MKGRVMSVKRIQGEIAQAQADIIVNAANGCGWMGGKRCQSELHRGVAEHITMRYPGSRSKMKYIISLIPKLFDYCSNSGYKSIAVPCLGCGTGGLKSYDVISLIESESKYYPELDITIYEKGAKDTLPLNVCGESGKGMKFVYRR